MRRTGAACITVVMLIALYVIVVRLQSVSAEYYPTSFSQARLATSQRVQGLLIPACSFRFLESLPARLQAPGVRQTRLLCLSRQPLRSLRT
jgi:hypothetical protein